MVITFRFQHGFWTMRENTKDQKGRLQRRPFLKLGGIAGGSTLIAKKSSAKDDNSKSKKNTDDDQNMNSNSSNKPHVHIFGTGGTIAHPEGEGFLTGNELVERTPELQQIATISTTGISQLGSSELTPQVLYKLRNNIMKVAKSETPPDGMVVSHGSNTVEETAYFLNLTLDTKIPVVTTAAQRNVGALSSDSAKNLFDAVEVAVHPDARDRGVLFVGNDEIHHSRDVYKLVTNRPDAWESPNFGKVGLAEEDPEVEIEFYRDTTRRSTPDTQFDLANTSPEEFPLSEIYIVYSSIASNDTLVNAAIENNAKGIVVAALPTGDASAPAEMRGQSTALGEAAKNGIPVVISHRGTQGKISKTSLENDDFIWADTLLPQKARILLALGLVNKCDINELQELFSVY